MWKWSIPEGLLYSPSVHHWHEKSSWFPHSKGPLTSLSFNRGAGDFCWPEQNQCVVQPSLDFFFFFFFGKKLQQSRMIINKMTRRHQHFKSRGAVVFWFGECLQHEIITDDFLLANSWPSFLCCFAQCVFNLLHNVTAAPWFNALFCGTSSLLFVSPLLVHLLFYLLCFNKDQRPLSEHDVWKVNTERLVWCIQTHVDF